MIVFCDDEELDVDVDKFEYFKSMLNFNSNIGIQDERIEVTRDVLYFLKKIHNGFVDPFTDDEFILADYFGLTNYDQCGDNGILFYVKKTRILELNKTTECEIKRMIPHFTSEKLPDKMQFKMSRKFSKRLVIEKAMINFESFISSKTNKILAGGFQLMKKYRGIIGDICYENYYICTNKKSPDLHDEIFKDKFKIFEEGLNSLNIKFKITTRDEYTDFETDFFIISLQHKIYKSKQNILDTFGFGAESIIRTLANDSQTNEFKYYTNGLGLIALRHNVNLFDFARNTTKDEYYILDLCFNTQYSIYILFFEYYKNRICRDINFGISKSQIFENIFGTYKTFNQVLYEENYLISDIIYPKFIIPSELTNDIKVQNIPTIKMERYSNAYYYKHAEIFQTNRSYSMNDFYVAINYLKEYEGDICIFGNLPFWILTSKKYLVNCDIIFVCKSQNEAIKLANFLPYTFRYSIIVEEFYENLFYNNPTKPKVILRCNSGNLELLCSDITLYEISHSILPKSQYGHIQGANFRAIDE